MFSGLIKSHKKGFLQQFSALNELYRYLDQHKDAVLEALERNEHAVGSQLPGRLQVRFPTSGSDNQSRDFWTRHELDP